MKESKFVELLDRIILTDKVILFDDDVAMIRELILSLKKSESIQVKIAKVNSETFSHFIMKWLSTRYTTFSDGDKYRLASALVDMVHKEDK